MGPSGSGQALDLQRAVALQGEPPQEEPEVGSEGELRQAEEDQVEGHSQKVRRASGTEQ